MREYLLVLAKSLVGLTHFNAAASPNLILSILKIIFGAFEISVVEPELYQQLEYTS
jgi:hypothetical protein